MNSKTPRIAIVADWLTTYAGAERVIEQMIKCFPEADIFSLVDFVPEDERSFLQGKQVQTSFMQNLPFAKKHFRAMLPLMPYAIESFDLSNYDIILTSHHAVAKGIITGPDQLHICYCHSPARYAWDLQHQYLGGAGFFATWKARLAHITLHHFRNWDVISANRPDHFIANSTFIKRRIKKLYRRDADVIHPPVNTESFTQGTERGDYYLTTSRLVPYKRVDMIVQAFCDMPDRQLKVIGDGSEMDRIKMLVQKHSNIELLGAVSSDEMTPLLQCAKAFIMAAKEDFGIAPVEAQACGVPVIAYSAGGALDTIIGLDKPEPTGVLFYEQTPKSLIAAVDQFEEQASYIKPKNCRANAEKFSEDAFCKNLTDYVMKRWKAQT